MTNGKRTLKRILAVIVVAAFGASTLPCDFAYAESVPEKPGAKVSGKIAAVYNPKAEALTSQYMELKNGLAEKSEDNLSTTIKPKENSPTAKILATYGDLLNKRTEDLPNKELLDILKNILSLARESGDKEILEYIKHAEGIYKNTEEKAGKNDDKNSDEYDLSIVPDSEGQEPHEAISDIDAEELIKSLFLTPFDVNGDGIIDTEDVDLIWLALGETDIYFESPGLKYFIIDQNGDGEINEEDYLIAFGRIDLSASDTDSLEYFVYSLFVELFDTNGNEQVDAEDDNILEYWRIFDRYRSLIGSSLPDHEMQELLGCIYVWIARNGWNRNMTLDLGNGIEANFSEAADGEKYTLTITSGEWTIAATYTRPPAIDIGHIEEMKEIFDDIKVAKQKIAGKLNDERVESVDIKLHAVQAIENQKVAYEAQPVYAYKTAKNQSPKQEAGSISKPNNLFEEAGKLETGEKVPAAKIDFAKNLNTVRANNVSLLKNEWAQHKNKLRQAFKGILLETPGAVYSSGKGAIVLLEAFSSYDAEDEDEGEEEDK